MTRRETIQAGRGAGPAGRLTSKSFHAFSFAANNGIRAGLARFLLIEETVTPAARLRPNQQPEEKQRQRTDLTSATHGGVRRSRASDPAPAGRR
jgi:hypothetical protein